MTANINDVIFEKLDPVYGPGLGVAELLIAWWADEGHTGYPANDALYAAMGGTGTLPDSLYAYWLAFTVGEPITYTIFGDTADGWINSIQGDLDTGENATTTGDIYVGQNVGPAYCYEGFISFDTSLALGTITAVTLSLFGSNDTSTTNFTLEARPYDWGATLTSADYRTRAQVTSAALLASISTAGWNAAGYNVLTSQAAFLSNINQAGTTRLILCSDRYRTAVTASTAEYVGMKSADAGGTTNDPKLVIEALV